MRALLLVDIQNDFMPGGALPVPQGDLILPNVRQLLALPFEIKVATKDWHPKGHESFADTHLRQPGEVMKIEGIDQVLWPVHCVQDTGGSQFALGWDVSLIDKVVLKGTHQKVDSYSTFFDNARRRETGLELYLRDQGVKELYIAGLATDYCVLYSAMDALDLGFATYVVTDACRGIDLHPGDVDKALQQIRECGGHLVTTEQVQRQLG